MYLADEVFRGGVATPRQRRYIVVAMYPSACQSLRLSDVCCFLAWVRPSVHFLTCGSPISPSALVDCDVLDHNWLLASCVGMQPTETTNNNSIGISTIKS